MKNSESQFHWTVAVHRQVKKSNLKKKKTIEVKMLRVKGQLGSSSCSYLKADDKSFCSQATTDSDQPIQAAH